MITDTPHASFHYLRIKSGYTNSNGLNSSGSTNVNPTSLDSIPSALGFQLYLEAAAAIKVIVTGDLSALILQLMARHTVPDEQVPAIL